jgi:3-oxosteroid 1-dehydrogenase
VSKLPEEVDIISIGSGAAGCAAAVSAAQNGLRSLLLEKGSTLGGGTAFSLGGLWAPCNPYMADAGFPDDPEAATGYLSWLGGAAANRRNLDTYIRETAATLKAFESAGMTFRMIDNFPDHYFPTAPGSSPKGRSLEARPITEGELGQFAGRIHDSPYIQRGLNWSDAVAWGGFGNIRNWNHDELQARRDRGQLGSGQALIGQFLAALDRLGGQVVTDFRVTGLIWEDERVAGVRGEHLGRACVIRAAKGVVIATGGYEGSPELIHRYEGLPGWANMFPPTLEGDGLVMATELGAVVYRLPVNLRMMLGYIEPSTKPGVPAGFRIAGPRGLSYPHSIVVNRHGRRFADEAQFQYAVPAIQQYDPLRHEYTNLPCYMIFDQDYLDRYSFAGQNPGAPPPPWLARFDSPAELANHLGIDPAGFVATLDSFNLEAAQGRDPVFGRGNSSWAKSTAGDREHKVNPNIAPVARAPFYGLPLCPSGIGSAGLQVDEAARVQHVRGNPIAGLYACGNAAAPTDYGIGYQAGLTLMSGMIFGRLAVLDALK